jgi:hypothetical protein
VVQFPIPEEIVPFISKPIFVALSMLSPIYEFFLGSLLGDKSGHDIILSIVGALA